MVRALINAIGFVLLIALATHFLGLDIINLAVDHIVDGIREAAEIGEKIGQGGTSSRLVDTARGWLGK